MSEPSPTQTAPCPNCGEPAGGRFCANCGTPLSGVACGACHTELAPGARFCHRCGTPVALPGGGASSQAAGAPFGEPGSESTAGRTGGDTLPWAVAGVAFLALLVVFAGQRFTHGGGSNDGAGNDAGSAASASVAVGPAPDISNMSPEERASRLYDRMMGWSEAGRRDTVMMFAPMATAAYEMLDSMTLGDRYDLGRIGEVSGGYPLAAAQADTILQHNPNHLLGLILAAQAAHSMHQPAAEQQYLDRLRKAAPAEQAKKLPEYQQHANDIKAALEQARKH